MRKIDTKALSLVSPSMGVGNPATVTAPVEFEDGILQQSFGVADLIRRAMAPGAPDTEGYWGLIMTNVHAGAGTEVNTLDPYDVAAPAPDYPGEHDLSHFDAWLVGPFNAFADGAVLTSAQFRLNWPDARSITAGSGGVQQQIVLYSGTDTLSGNRLVEQGAIGAMVQRPNFAHRIPRGVTLQWITTTAAADTGISIQGALLLLPRGMGQDAK